MTVIDVMPAARPAAGSSPPTAFSDAVLAALATVTEPEFGHSITAVGFVRSVAIKDRGVTARLRLPTGFCSPGLADLILSDTGDALRAVPGIGRVRVILDERRDPDGIDQGAVSGPIGAAGPENQNDREELRTTLRRRAHAAAMERCCRMMLERGTWTIEELPALELLDLPDGLPKSALLRRRAALGLSDESHALVVVDHQGRPADLAALRAQSVPVSCRSAEGLAPPCRTGCAMRPAGPPPATA